MTIRVVIADDQSIIRAGRATILNAQPDLDVVGQAANGREAIDLALRLRPDVLAWCRSTTRCASSTSRCRHRWRRSHATGRGPRRREPMAVVIVTTLDTDDNIYGALQAGARGFLLKDAPPEQLAEALRAAVRSDARPPITERSGRSGRRTTRT